jgi:hypothetical protein
LRITNKKIKTFAVAGNEIENPAQARKKVSNPNRSKALENANKLAQRTR